MNEIREIAAKADVHPEEHKPVVLERDGDVVYVAMKDTDFQAVEQWLSQQWPASEITSEQRRRGEAYDQAQRALLDPDIEAYKRMLPELLKTHKGKWVAVHGGELVDSDDEFAALAERVNVRFAHSQPVLMEQVQEEFPRVHEVPSILEFTYVPVQR